MVITVFTILLIVWILSIVAVIFALYVRPHIEKKRINRGLSMTQYRVRVPRTGAKEGVDPKELIGVMEQLYAGFSYLKMGDWLERFMMGEPYISLEIVSPNERDEINFYIGVPKGYESIFEKQLHGFYPTAELESSSDYNVMTPNGKVRAAYLKLAKPKILPIRTYQHLETDPLAGITSALSKIQEDESAVVQVLLKKSSSGMSKKARQVAKSIQQKGRSFEQAYKEQYGSGIEKIMAEIFKPKESDQGVRLTPFDENIIKGIEEKTSKIAFETNIRLMTVSQNETRAELLLDQLQGAFSQFASEEWNEFSISRYHPEKIQKFLYKFIFRVFDNSESILLNSAELTSIYHIPTPLLSTPKIQWVSSKASHPPVDLPKEGLLLGKNVFRGEEQLVRITQEDRRRHMYLIGQTGTGKTSLMKKMIEGDLRAGNGIALLDPNGDFAEDVLGMIPKDRIDDLIYFNPQDMEYPLGLNVLEARTPEERDFLIQEMISIFYALVSDPSMIGPMFEHNMRMAMAVLMADPEHPYTIVEIPKLFTDEVFRAKILKKVHDPILLDFWLKEFPASQKGSQAGDMLGYLLSKLGRFIENEMIRNIIGQQHSSIDFPDIMNSGKILIANLSKGAIGDQNSQLLGMLLVSKLQVSAFKRANIPEDERRDFYLYLDEFQNFTTDSISTILSEARKYRLDMVLAHQFVGQLPDNIRNAVFGNVGTTVSFRIGTEDAEVLAQKMQPEYNAQDLVEIDNLNAVIKLMINGKTSKAFNMQVIFADRGKKELQEALKELSRLEHGTKNTIVEMEMKMRR